MRKSNMKKQKRAGRVFLLAAVLLVLTNWVKPTKNLHPIVFIMLSALVGIIVK